MIFKYVMRNVFDNPGRFLVLVFCIAAASFAGYLLLDFSDSLETVFLEETKMFYGNADFKVASGGDYSGCPSYTAVRVKSHDKREVSRIANYYSYAFTEYYETYGTDDWHEAYNMGLITTDVALSDGEIAVTQRYADNTGITVGDTVEFESNDGYFEQTVVAVIPDGRIADSGSGCILGTMELVDKIDTDQMAFDVQYIDVAAADVSEFEKIFRANNPGRFIAGLAIDDEMLEMIEGMRKLFAIVFVICFLLVVFVTVSFTKKIIEERMSVIGTLKSVSISSGKTVRILLYENLFYGICGCTVSTLLYILIRRIIMKGVLLGAGPEISLFPPFHVIAAVVAGTTSIELILPALAFVKAVRTPIRDIIFNNKDTEYKLSKTKTAGGCVLLAAGIVGGPVFGNSYAAIFSIVAFFFGVALVYPVIAVAFCKVLQKLFAKRPLPEFAAIEAGTKKSDIGNGILAVTAIAASAVIFMMVSSNAERMTETGYDADVIVSTGYADKDQFDVVNRIDGIEEIQYVLSDLDNISVGGKTFFETIYSMPDGDMLDISGLPESMEENEFAADKYVANMLGMQPGDTREITFRVDGFFPVTKEMTLVSYCNSLYLSETGSIVLNPYIYNMLYNGDEVSEILIKTDDPDGVADALGKVLSADYDVSTDEEYKASLASDKKATTRIACALAAMALSLTLIGIVGNQVIAFEERTKEFAILSCTSMSRQKITRLILLENVFVFALSCILAVPVAIYTVLVLGRVLNSLNVVAFELAINPPELIVFVLIVFAAMLLTVIKPVSALKKMNIANEIKYE